MRDRGTEKVSVNGEDVGSGEDLKPVSKKGKEVDMTDFDPDKFIHSGGHPRQWIILRDTGQPNESKTPFVSLNGFALRMQKNVPINVPVPVIEMMKLCVYTKIERDPDTGEEYTRNIPRFSIERLDHAPDGTDQGSEKSIS
jgi:hypothetical protein